MFILVKDRRKIISCDLALSYTFEYKGIRIYQKNTFFYLSLKDGYRLQNGDMIVRISDLHYLIEAPEGFNQIEVFIYENAEGINDYAFYQKRDFLIATDPRCDIICRDPHLKEYYLYYKQGIISSNYDVIVNGSRYEGTLLNNGDKVEFLGIVFFHFEDFIYLNAFNNECRLHAYSFKRQKLLYRRQLPKAYPLLKQDYGSLIPTELKNYEPLNEGQSTDIIRNILPNIIMSLSIMTISILNILNSYLSDHFNPLQSAVYIISPSAMILSGIFLPLIFYHQEKKSRKAAKEKHVNEYLEYLKEYKEKLDKDLQNFISSQQKHLFTIDDEHPLFYLSQRDEDFLTLTLGTMIYSLEIPYEKSQVPLIDKQLEKIADQARNIENYPLLLKISEYRHVSIVCKPSQVSAYFERFLLELAYKHHYHDLHLAIYCEDYAFISRFYNLPHLFYNGRRLTMLKAGQLQELDQLKLDKPLILLLKEKVSFSFSNPLIHVICFIEDREGISKNSDCVIEYLNNLAYLYTDRQQKFKDLQISRPFEKYCYQLGKYNEFLHESNDHSFKELFGDADLKNFYQHKNQDLKASFAYSENELLHFDLHENSQGPHGLIAGTTGSGKSELIVSLLLSLCIRYPADYLNIILIDYKGGGILESLSYQNKAVPQIIAAISNLENNIFERLIIALNNECLKRERLFRKLSELSGISIMNLDDYLQNDYENYGLEKIAHLLIVVDEFAEMKKENPEQIKELISLSRIGRSLGLHLILSTQKPSGNIDDEIFSNSHFKISLRVFEEKDSQDIIRSKDAAYLNKAGQFYLRVDESLIKAQSIYAKKDLNDDEPYEVGIYDEQLQIRRKRKIVNKSGISQAADFVRRIMETHEELQIKAGVFSFLPPLPLTRKEVKSEGVVIGVSDDYLRKESRILSYPYTEDLLIYSSRKEEMKLFLNALNEAERRCIVIAADHYQNAVISDSLLYEEEEDIFYLYERLLKEDHEVTLLIEDLSCLFSYHENHQEYLLKLLKRSENLSLNIIAFTRNAQLPFKLITSFRNRFLIEVNDIADLAYFFSGRCQYKGNSFYYDEQIIPFVPLQLEAFEKGTGIYQPLLKKIPPFIKQEIENGHCLLGYDLKEKDKVFSTRETLITSFDEEAVAVYREAYGELLKTEVYDLKMKWDKDILWLGPGIFSQRLFVSGLKEELKEDEALFISKGKRTVLRSLSHA